MAKKKHESAKEYIRISHTNKMWLEGEIKSPERTPNDVISRIRNQKKGNL